MPWKECSVMDDSTLCHVCPRAGPRSKWRAQGDDFRTFLQDFVASLPQVEFHAGSSLSHDSELARRDSYAPAPICRKRVAKSK